ncbi:sodium-dependent noradrenaline transporter-like [Haliotis rufescens]|uniref:sodium-dependent noradrenaline transporter-like n=1 Tax=Haliotis rufescens TaxID=6454 RepID=UPI00201ED7C8|nr:sodium-dependent noradrenaline transporter-like [Haliotis rufescens]
MPLFFLDNALGQFSAQGPIKVWSMCPVMTVILTLDCLIVPYFSMVFAWALYYVYCSYTPVLPWTTCGGSSAAPHPPLSVYGDDATRLWISNRRHQGYQEGILKQKNQSKINKSTGLAHEPPPSGTGI